MFSTGTAVGTAVTEVGTSVACSVGIDDGADVVGLNHGGIVTCAVGIGARETVELGPKLGAMIGAFDGAIVGANDGFIVGRTLTENTVGEADGNADGSTPGIILMICPRAKSVDTVDDCCPTCNDQMNRHWSAIMKTVLHCGRILVLELVMDVAVIGVAVLLQ
jgi:hypothetical protein